jgi:SAM-dependent methyltransferase
VGAPKGTSRRSVRTEFDEGYVRRFYLDPATRVVDRRSHRLHADFVFAALRYLRLPVRRLLDAGCGIGLWRESLARHHPKAGYVGLEKSDWLCRRFGWLPADLAGFETRLRFDLVVCQSVLQYLDDSTAERGLANLGRLCRGALFFEVLTRLDWEKGCDRTRTDGRVHLREGDWYRERLDPHFVEVGGGVFVRRTAPVHLFELERRAPVSRRPRRSPSAGRG